MKALLKYVFVLILLLPALKGYAFCEPVETYPCDPCCSNYNAFTGTYIGINGGYSWYRFALHRPTTQILLPLSRNPHDLEDEIPFIAVGYDLYPRYHIPTRLEINFTYADIKFATRPLYPPEFNNSTFALDNFLVRNLMGTLYFDLHTCNRLVPYVGVSLGLIRLKTAHELHTLNTPTKSYSNDDTELSWGGTIGSRFFFTNHWVANLQLRFNELRRLAFYNFKNQLVALPGRRDYLSDYLHERSIVIGVGYEF